MVKLIKCKLGLGGRSLKFEGPPFIKTKKSRAFATYYKKNPIYMICFVKLRNTCALLMIKIEVTICIHKNLHLYTIININIQI